MGRFNHLSHRLGETHAEAHGTHEKAHGTHEAAHGTHEKAHGTHAAAHGTHATANGTTDVGSYEAEGGIASTVRGMRTLIRCVLSPFGDFIYPPRCLGCGDAVDAADPVCGACAASMIAHAFTAEESLRQLGSLHAPVHARAMYTGFEYEHEGVIEACLHAMKYRALERVGAWFGRQLGERLMESGRAPRDAVLVPVPLHRIKRIERGYNQAESICRGVAKETGWEVVPDALLRTRFTESQAVMRLDLESRRTNVAGVFCVNERRLAALRGRPVFLVDDLITTGATIGVCSLVLSERGIRDITLLAVARTSTLQDPTRSDVRHDVPSS